MNLLKPFNIDQEDISKKLEQSFINAYKKNNCLHDRRLISLYIANSGKLLYTYSRKGYLTVQMEFDTSTKTIGQSIILIYTNVHELQINIPNKINTSEWEWTDFGCCLENSFEINENGNIRQILVFENDATVNIVFEKLKFKNIRYEV